MALTKRSESNIVYLEVKHYCLWRPLKTKTNGCETLEVPNPRTGVTVIKHGYSFDTVSGRAIKLVKYDTDKKYSTRYFGFKLHLLDGAQTYVLDMPYQSQVLRRFLRVARNFDWSLPLSITVFKGKKAAGEIEPTGIWFQQLGETIKAYYTRENPHGMPEATQDPDTHEWDFKAQHRWLVEKLKAETIPDIEAAAARVAPPIEPETAEFFEEPENDATEPSETVSTVHGGIADESDVPF